MCICSVEDYGQTRERGYEPVTDQTNQKNQEGSSEKKLPFRKRFWPFQWAVDIGFWRDVTSRCIAGSLVVLLGFIIGKSTGLIGSNISANEFYSSIVRVLLDIAVVIIGSIIILVVASRLEHMANGWLEKSNAAHPIPVVAKLLIWLLAFVALLFLIANCDVWGYYGLEPVLHPVLFQG